MDFCKPLDDNQKEEVINIDDIKPAVHVIAKQIVLNVYTYLKHTKEEENPADLTRNGHTI